MNFSAGVAHIFRLLASGIVLVLFTGVALAEKPVAADAPPKLQKKLEARPAPHAPSA